MKRFANLSRKFHTSAIAWKQNKKEKESKKVAKVRLFGKKAIEAAAVEKDDKKTKKKVVRDEKEPRKEYIKKEWTPPTPKLFFKMDGKIESSNSLRDYLMNIQTIDLDNSTGFFGFKELVDAPTLKSHQVAQFEKLTVLNAHDVLTKNSSDFLQVVKEIDSIIADLQYKCQLVVGYHTFDQLVTTASTVLSLTEAYIDQNLAHKLPDFYKKLKGSLSEYKGDDLLFVQNKLIEYESRGAHLPAEERLNFGVVAERFEMKLEEYKKLIRDFAPVEIPSPTRLFEIPRDVFGEVAKKKIAKKRHALLNLGEQAEATIRSATIPQLLKDVFYKTRSPLFDKNGQFAVVLPELVRASKDLAKLRGFENLIQMKDSNLDFSTSQTLQTMHNLQLAFDFDTVLKGCEKVKGSSADQIHVPYYTSQYYRNMEQWHTLSHFEFLSVPSVIGAISGLFTELFGVSIVESKLLRGESWDPLTIKKLSIQKNGASIGHVYLDILSRKGVNKPKHPTLLSHKGSALISADFGDSYLEIPALLTTTQSRELMNVFSQIIYQFQTTTPNSIVSNVFVKTMERFTFDTQFLKKLKHYYTNATVPDQIETDLKTVPVVDPYDLHRMIFYSNIDTTLFEKDVVDVGAFIKKSEENSFGMEIFPSWTMISQFSGNLPAELYARILAAQIWHGKKDLNAFFASGTTQQVLSKVLGNEKPSHEFLVKDLKWTL